MLKFKRKDRRPTFTPQDIENLKWFWTNYLRPKTKWMGVIFVLVILQGLVFQQFLSLSENGLRTIFDKGDLGKLVWVCAAVFALFAFRGIASYVTARLSAWIASDAVANMRQDWPVSVCSPLSFGSCNGPQATSKTSRKTPSTPRALI